MSEIAGKIEFIKKKIGNGVKLVAVSKTKPPEDILEAYKSGHRIFGENKVQELVYKHETLPQDIEWHMIGHLQTNKVKYIASFISLVHSVDSLKVLRAVNNEAKKNNRIISCLFQVKIAQEDTKYGFSFGELIDVLESEEFSTFTNVKFAGLMGMATFTDSDEQIREEFRLLKNYFQELKNSYFSNIDYFSEISMGMSDDYEIAIEEGSTMIRVGSNIFGERIYL
ncbi:MAG: YggS family pyridoxal phosphate-dependent enzyme [Bacteroidales bacterium]|nr:YggS family pyridoxal phosphate-dependent enzyme [Bacteroidales bacterium]MBN2817886.1 YggS family pyridoxal phosphate-dependent enzyme [Bacteroidales bacterium]